MNFIKRITINTRDTNSYLSRIEGLNKFDTLNLVKPIVFFTGENGTGKSTFLEAIAIHSGFNPEGGSKNFKFASNDTHSELYNTLTVSKSSRHYTDGFFLRAESFYNLATYIDNIGLGRDEYGGKSLHHQSHGESFLSLMKNRFRGNGLYILDEPEAALSLQNQLALMRLLHDLSTSGESQFIIATHSPLLLAIPNSQIISFDKETPLEITYEETAPYEIMSLFMTRRESILAHLFSDEE